MAVFADKTLSDRLSELATRAYEKGIPITTRFLSPEEAIYAVALGRKASVAATLFGGADNTERVMCCYHDKQDTPRFNIGIVKISWSDKQDAPGHRDLLGSVLSLGIDRAYVGDILIGTNDAYLFATGEMATLITQKLVSAARTDLHCEMMDYIPDLPTSEERLYKDTVASLRLDNVVAGGMHLSRGKAADWIISGRVSVNHEICQRTDAKLKQGDMISIRGFGRMRLNEIGPTTRKDRFPITLALYCNK